MTPSPKVPARSLVADRAPSSRPGTFGSYKRNVELHVVPRSVDPPVEADAAGPRCALCALARVRQLRKERNEGAQPEERALRPPDPAQGVGRRGAQGSVAAERGVTGRCAQTERPTPTRDARVDRIAAANVPRADPFAPAVLRVLPRREHRHAPRRDTRPALVRRRPRSFGAVRAPGAGVGGLPARPLRREDRRRPSQR